MRQAVNTDQFLLRENVDVYVDDIYKSKRRSMMKKSFSSGSRATEPDKVIVM